MQFHRIHQADILRPTLIFVPGFFTEPLNRNSPIDRSWDTQIKQICVSENVSGVLVRWPSGNIFSLDIRARDFLDTRALQTTLNAWGSAYTQSEIYTERIAQLIRSIQGGVILMGHSLGGKIVLKIAEQFPSPNLQKVIALAPALEVSKFDFREAARSVPTKPIICYSAKDRVLSLIFACGQSQNLLLTTLQNIRANPRVALHALSGVIEQRALHPAIGLVGVPKEFSHLYTTHDSRLRHYEYCRYTTDLWKTLHQ